MTYEYSAGPYQGLLCQLKEVLSTEEYSDTKKGSGRCAHAWADLNKNITKTRLCNFDPLKPHFYIVKLGFAGVYIIFLISAQKHRLWVLVRTASPRRF